MNPSIAERKAIKSFTNPASLDRDIILRGRGLYDRERLTKIGLWIWAPESKQKTFIIEEYNIR